MHKTWGGRFVCYQDQLNPVSHCDDSAFMPWYFFGPLFSCRENRHATGTFWFRE